MTLWACEVCGKPVDVYVGPIVHEACKGKKTLSFEEWAKLNRRLK